MTLGAVTYFRLAVLPSRNVEIPMHISLVVAAIFWATNAPDIRTVNADLDVPVAEMGPSAAGKRVKEVLPRYTDTNVYHVTYLPKEWEPGTRFPVIIEYAGNGNYQNQYGDISTGRVEDSKLGYGIFAGRTAIWVCLPYLNDKGTENVITWWGDAPHHDPRATIEYCKLAVPWICSTYGGDSERVVLTGFSRGAIACNYIGLHDDQIAKLWCAFVPFSHYDGVVNWGYAGSGRTAAAERLRRLGERPQFICAEVGEGNHSVEATRRYLGASEVGRHFAFRSTGFRNHNDSWIIRPSDARTELRRWISTVLGLP
jgi:hypothetical protein